MYKGSQVWVKDGTTVSKTAIDANGVWELQEGTAIRSDIDCTIMFSSVSANASGATVAAGLRTVKAVTPVAITGASKVIAVNGAQDSLDVLFQPKGRIVLTVTGYVAPFVAEVVQ